MKPVVTVEEMGAIDAESTVAPQTLIERAGTAVAHTSLRLLGGPYGRRVVVVAGKGHNGDDGRVAGAVLSNRGVRVTIVDPGGESCLPDCDLVIDAAYGTGFKGDYAAPSVPPGAKVVAVDIPSGVNGNTGEACDGAVTADVTVTFAALKPGLLMNEGFIRSGRVEVADIGLDTSRARIHLVEDQDVLCGLPRRKRESHKWETALYVAAGSPGMMGSAHLCSTAAMRAGAGMVRLGVPGISTSDLPVAEVVATSLPSSGWDGDVLSVLSRCRALVVGPGLGRSSDVEEAVRHLVSASDVPVLVDADGLNALGAAEVVGQLVSHRRHPLVLTPHSGEYAHLAGSPPGADRLSAARSLASTAGAIVLLKGSTTVVAEPDGRAMVVTSGSSQLATAGTGDVLSGVIGAFLARGMDALSAAAYGAHAHGRAASMGLPEGLVAGDLLWLVPRWLSGWGGRARWGQPGSPHGGRRQPRTVSRRRRGLYGRRGWGA